ncbi:MAG: hypothetical protein LBC82_09005 [Oscillospiraceae bacterium]|jgi:hypothetical protein|nr:hypothetical protein [Oscillospiraceae bacterium]
MTSTVKVHKTDVYEDFCENYKIGDISEYPVDIAAIHAYGITVAEMEPYYDPKYAKTHWSVILKEILSKREE